MPEQEITFRRTATGSSRSAPTPPRRRVEASDAFRCFGTTCAVFVIGDTPQRTSVEAVELARSVLIEWHAAFSRFSPTASCRG